MRHPDIGFDWARTHVRNPDMGHPNLLDMLDCIFGVNYAC